jgi:methionyl aminopeptidase
MTIASSTDLAGMQRVGRLVAETLAHVRALVRPGVTTAALDEAAARFARARGARSAPQLTYGFPGFTCISVNDAVVHGVPGAHALAAGDVVKLDVTLEVDGYMADSAVTVCVPPVSATAQRLQHAVRQALRRGLEAARAGARVRDIGAAVEAAARAGGATVLRELEGHGIGRRLHEEPSVPNWADPRAGQPLVEGLVLAVEPMLAAQPTRVTEDADGWTLRTARRVLAVHAEHTIVVQRGTPLVLTRL